MKWYLLLIALIGLALLLVLRPSRLFENGISAPFGQAESPLVSESPESAPSDDAYRSSAESASPASELDQAFALVGEGQLAEAETLVNTVLEKDESNETALLMLADLYARDPLRKKEALAIWEKLIGAHPESHHALANYVTLSRTLGETDRALRFLSESGVPETTESNSVLASLYQSNGELAKAAQTLERNLSHDFPEKAENLESIGKIYRDMGQNSLAQKYFERALAEVDAYNSQDLYPPKSSLNAARLYVATCIENKDPAAAVSVLKRLMEADAENEVYQDWASQIEASIGKTF